MPAPACEVGAAGLEPTIFCSQSRRASHYATPRGAPGSSAETSDRSPRRPLVESRALAAGRPIEPLGGQREVCPGVSRTRRIAGAQTSPVSGRARPAHQHRS